VFSNKKIKRKKLFWQDFGKKLAVEINTRIVLLTPDFAPPKTTSADLVIMVQ